MIKPIPKWAVFALLLVVSGCGGGGGSSSAPSISHLQIVPSSALQYDGNGTVMITVTFDFSDPGGDLSTVYLTDSQGGSGAIPITGITGQTTGTIIGTLEVSTTTLGHYAFDIYVTDVPGNRSNTLTGTFDVNPNDTASHWTVQTLPAGLSGALNAVAWSGDRFVAVGIIGTFPDTAAGLILTSPDGVTWTDAAADVSVALLGVAWSGDKFVAVGEAGTILTSPDGVNWNPAVAPAPDLTLVGVTATQNQYVAVGSQRNPSAGSASALIMTSSDGVTWNRVPLSASVALNGVTTSPTLIVAVGVTSGLPNAEPVVLVSADGMQWTTLILASYGVLENVVWSGSQFLAVGYQAVFRSVDGHNWEPTGQGIVSGTRGAWSGQRFLVCDFVYCQSSTDGINWGDALQLLDPSVDPRALVWGDAHWVLAGNLGSAPVVLTSP